MTVTHIFILTASLSIYGLMEILCQVTLHHKNVNELD